MTAIERGVNYADIYAKKVRRSPKKYPDTIKLMVDRYYEWKKRKDIWFDVDRANEMMDWVQTFIRHVKGRRSSRKATYFRRLATVCF